jgi:hypothetical protein
VVFPGGHDEGGAGNHLYAPLASAASLGSVPEDDVPAEYLDDENKNVA